MSTLLAKLALTGRQAVGLIVLAVAVLGGYLWNLSANGYANLYYAAAAMPGSRSFSSAFFGSLDLGNGASVDKSPLAMWPIDFSVWLFGLNSFGLLLPQVLMGVATVLILFFSVRSSFGYGAGIVAGLVFALTPVVALMFRFDNPDAVLTLLLTAATAAAIRLHRTGLTRWAWITGVLFGLAFLAKLLQGVIILPALALVFLLFGSVPLAKRVRQLLAAGAGLVLAGGWWFLIVALIPASARPYQSGTQHNSIWELIFGYNGIGRITGNENGRKHFIANSSLFAAEGPARLFQQSIAGQVSWLLPAAVVVGVLLLVLCWRKRQEDTRFFATAAWLSGLLITYPVFALMQGIFHAYYVVALAPGIAALCGTGFWLLRQAQPRWVQIVLALTLLGTGVWAGIIFTFTQDYKYLWYVPALAGLLSAALLLLGLPTSERQDYRRIFGLLLAVTALVGPTVFTINTISAANTGGNPVAGPVIGTLVTGGLSVRSGTGASSSPSATTSPTPSATPSVKPHRSTAAPVPVAAVCKGPGASVGTAEKQAQVLGRYLDASAKDYRWSATILGAAPASELQVYTGRSILPIGGYNLLDPYPTRAQLQHYAATKQLRYFLDASPATTTSDTQPLNRWAAEHYKPIRCGQWLVYDLQQQPTP